MLTSEQATALAIDTTKAFRSEHARLNRFVRYIRGRQKLPWLPDNVDGEYRDIAVKSASNWLDLVLRASVQGLYVDGYGDAEQSDLWGTVWQANGMDARQHALHKAAGSLGYAFLIVFPSDDGGVWMRPESATNMAAVYDDPADEWPRHAVRITGKDRFELYDAEARYTIDRGMVTVAPHDLGFTPVAQMRWGMDLLGTPMGEVEPVITIQDRIVDATFTLQMVAKYGAFPQRWIAGIDTSKPLVDDDGNVLTDSDGNPLFPTIKAYVDSILTAVDPDTKFGQFAAADLRQYVEALEAHIRHLAAITQTPPHYLLGSLVNLSAEALAAAEAGLQRKIAEKRVVLGEGYEQSMRAAAAILGNEEAANDMSSQVRWRDVESRSLAQTSDALLKLSQLGVPAEVLFAKIPGFSDQDVQRALAIREASGGIDALMRQIEAANTPQTPADPLA
ncbi:MAG: phage portal protein [Acidimicrobiia bacterium]|nr:MAG: phage portal protein [Acidimicrobiia bacterium]